MAPPPTATELSPAAGTLTKRGLRTRQAILDAARDLFHQQGIHATSVDDILEASHTGKSQFYHYFQSKEGLVQCLIDDFMDRLEAGETVFKPAISSWHELEIWFENHVILARDYDCSRGCIIGTLAHDMSTASEELRQTIERCFGLIRHQPQRFFEKLQVENRLSTDLDPGALADLCVSVLQGGLLMTKVSHDIAALEHSIAHTLTYLKSLDSEETSTKHSTASTPPA